MIHDQGFRQKPDLNGGLEGQVFLHFVRVIVVMIEWLSKDL